MSQMGQSRRSGPIDAASALPLIAEIDAPRRVCRDGPTGDIIQSPRQLEQARWAARQVQGHLRSCD